MRNRLLQTRFIEIDPHKCRACWKCVDQCPRKVLEKVGFFMHRHIRLSDMEACIGCGKCIKACAHGVF
ncbi:MAG: 4Fe-4S binding protein, partial [Alistipes sp.]|nr:4Fe-4S binding protein [Alistipes sp.]